MRIYLQSAVVEVHDDSASGAEPLLHEDGGGPGLAHQHVAAVDQVLVHVLREVHQQRRLLLVLLGRVLQAPAEHAVTQVVVLDRPASKNGTIYQQ